MNEYGGAGRNHDGEGRCVPLSFAARTSSDLAS